MIHSRRDGVAEANACFVIPHFLQQNDVRIDRPKNIGRCRDPLRLYFAAPYREQNRSGTIRDSRL